MGLFDLEHSKRDGLSQVLVYGDDIYLVADSVMRRRTE